MVEWHIFGALVQEVKVPGINTLQTSHLVTPEVNCTSSPCSQDQNTAHREEWPPPLFMLHPHNVSVCGYAPAVQQKHRRQLQPSLEIIRPAHEELQVWKSSGRRDWSPSTLHRWVLCQPSDCIKNSTSTSHPNPAPSFRLFDRGWASTACEETPARCGTDSTECSGATVPQMPS